MRDTTLYLWVRQAIRSGLIRFGEPIELSEKEIHQNPILHEVFTREAIEEIISGIVSSYNRRSELGFRERVALALNGVFGDLPQSGAPPRDDDAWLDEIYYTVYPQGTPEIFFRDPSAWEKPPPTANYAELARDVSGFENEAETRRLVRKFKAAFPYLVARQIMGDALRIHVKHAVKDVADAMQRHRLPYQTY
jgi:hypothetical protein